MEIKINLPEWKCEALLRKHGYITEEVTAYYENSIDPYNNDKNNDLKSIKIRIAYSKWARPEELKNEHPMLHAINDFAYDKVINRLFNSDLWEVLISNS